MHHRRSHRFLGYLRGGHPIRAIVEINAPQGGALETGWLEIQDRICGAARITYSYEGTAYDFGGAKVSSGDITLDNTDNLFSPAGHPDSLFSPAGISRARVRVRYDDHIVFLGYATPKASFADRGRRQAKLKLLGIESIIYALPAPALYENSVFLEDYGLDYNPGTQYEIYNLHPDPLDTRNSLLQRVAIAINSVFPDIDFLFDLWREPELPNARNSLSGVEIPDYDLDSERLLEGVASIGDVLNKILAFENSTLQYDYSLKAITLKGRGVLTPQSAAPLSLRDILEVKQFSDGAEKVINQIRREHYDQAWGTEAHGSATELVEAPGSVRSFGRRSATIDGSFTWTEDNAPANARHRIYTDDFARYLLNTLERPRKTVVALAPIEVDGIPPSYWSLGQPFVLRPRYEIPAGTPTYSTDNPSAPVDVVTSVFDAATSDPETRWFKNFGNMLFPEGDTRLNLLPLLTETSDLSVLVDVAADTYATITAFEIIPASLNLGHVFSFTLSAELPAAGNFWLGFRFGDVEVFAEIPAGVETSGEYVYTLNPATGISASRWAQIERRTTTENFAAIILDAALAPFRLVRASNNDLLRIDALVSHKNPEAALPWHYAPSDFPDPPTEFTAEPGDGNFFLRFTDENKVPVIYYDRRYRKVGDPDWIELLDFMRIIRAGSSESGVHQPQEDFNTISADGIGNPHAIAHTTNYLYIYDQTDQKIYAISRLTKQHVPAADFSTSQLGPAANGISCLFADEEAGLLYAGYTYATRKIYAFSLTTKARVTASEYPRAGNFPNSININGLWMDENYVYIINTSPQSILAYSKADGIAVAAENYANAIFNPLQLFGPTGLWGDERYMYVLNCRPADKVKIFAFDRTTKQHVPDADFNTLIDAGVNTATNGVNGLTAPAGLMYVLSRAPVNKIFAFSYSQEASPSYGPRVPGLDNGEVYQVTMRCRNTSGPSPWIDPPLLVTPLARTGFVGQVTLVVAADVEDSVIVSWKPYAPLPAGVSIDQYRLVWGTGNTWSTTNVAATETRVVLPPSGQAALIAAATYSLAIYADLSDNTSVAVGSVNFTRDGGVVV